MDECDTKGRENPGNCAHTTLSWGASGERAGVRASVCSHLIFGVVGSNPIATGRSSAATSPRTSLEETPPERGAPAPRAGFWTFSPSLAERDNDKPWA